MKTLEYYKEMLEKQGVVLPEGVIKNEEHYFSKLYIARKLRDLNYNQEAYDMMRQMYEMNEVRFDKTLYASHEDYIEEKVKFFVELAQLSYVVTQQPAQSIPYLDEALVRLDSEESSYPYISKTEIEKLKQEYVNLVG